MRYAVIADVHGNLLALETILRDAAQQQVDQYLFAGDYCISHPQPNDCLNRIRELPNSIVIRASLRLLRDEMKNSLSLVVKPHPVSNDVTWKRARSSGKPMKRNSMVNSSLMIQYTRMISAKSENAA